MKSYKLGAVDRCNQKCAAAIDKQDMQRYYRLCLQMTKKNIKDLSHTKLLEYVIVVITIPLALLGL